MPPPSSPDRPRPSRPARRKVSARVYRRRRIAAALAALLVLGLLTAAGGWGYTAFRFRQISSVHVPGLGKTPSDGSVNLLVVGSDTRQGLRDGGFGDAAGQRSGVIIVVHLVPAGRLRRLPRGRRRPRRGLDDGDQDPGPQPPAAAPRPTHHLPQRVPQPARRWLGRASMMDRWRRSSRSKSPST